MRSEYMRNYKQRYYAEMTEVERQAENWKRNQRRRKQRARNDNTSSTIHNRDGENDRVT